MIKSASSILNLPLDISYAISPAFLKISEFYSVLSLFQTDFGQVFGNFGSILGRFWVDFVWFSCLIPIIFPQILE